MATLVPFTLSSVAATVDPVAMTDVPTLSVVSADPQPSPTPDSPRTGEEYVIKRDGRRVPIDYNKISRRLRRLKQDVEKVLGRTLRVSIFKITQSTIRQIYNGITTSELDEEAAKVAAGMTDDPDYGDFAGAILASNLEANNRDTLSFAQYAEKAYGFVEERTHERCPLISQQLYDLAQKYGHLIDRRMVMARNLTYGYFAFQTLAKGGYLLGEYRTVQRNQRSLRMLVPFETPQHALMRVALGIHGNNMDAAFELYDALSQKKGTMATPTLFYSGTAHPQMFSCFLLAMRDDSLSGIYDTLKACAMISKDAGGVGLHIHNIRSTGSYIKGTNGVSNGLVPMLRVFNNTAKYVDQCFHPRTLVPTVDGPKPIGELTYNDRVITSDGTAQRVTKMLHHEYQGPVCLVSTRHSLDTVMVTPDHPLWSIPHPGPGGLGDQSLQRCLEEKVLVPDFVEVKKLKVGDLLGSPVPTYCEDAAAFSEADCRLLGILLGSGRWLRNHWNVKYDSEATLTFLREYWAQRLVTVTVTESEISWPHASLAAVTPSMVHESYEYMPNKRIPAFALHLPRAKIEQIVLGLLETTTASYSDATHFVMHFRDQNLQSKLRPSVHYLFLRLGVLAAHHELTMLRVAKVATLLRLLGLSERDAAEPDYLTWQGQLYSPITEVNLTLRSPGTDLVDFHIENNHNYLTQLGLASNGGGRRAGSFAQYLEPWHADVIEFLNLKRPHGAEEQRARDLFYALWVPDLFFQRIQQGLDTVWSLMDPKQCPGLSDTYGEAFEALYTQYEREGKFVKQVPIRQVVEAILTTQIETGTPYILAKDACNRKSNHKNLGTIKSSNLCVTGATKILTKEFGQVSIADVVDQVVSIWNGEQWSLSPVKQTSESSDIITVTFSNGSYIDCTEYHKFFIQDGFPSMNKKPKEVQAKDLQIGMRIPRFSLPDSTFADSKYECKYPYTQGLFAADGTYQLNKNPSLALYGAKQDLLQYLDVRSTTGVPTKRDVLNTLLPLDMHPKFFVPINASTKTKLDWLAGYLDGDGTVVHPPAPYTECITIQAVSVEKEFLLNIRLMLQTFGIESSVCHGKDEHTTMLPDGRGGKKSYNCQETWRLLISSTNVWHLKSIGFSPKRLDLSAMQSCPTNKSRSVKVVSITRKALPEATYCFNEPLRHAGLFNGILAGNCAEIVEYSSPEETACCVLASLSLPAFVKVAEQEFDYDGLYHATRIFIRALNRAIDINQYPLESAERSNLRHRPLGLGLQGLADVFCLLRLRFGSDASKKVNRRIAETMYFAALTESHALTQETDATGRKVGPYPSIDENGGAPIRHGLFQFDLWQADFKNTDQPDGWRPDPELGWDWEDLRTKVKKDGVRNSLVIASMPTASTSIILGNVESFEPYYGMIYVRSTKSGEYYQMCRPLVEELIRLGLWETKVHEPTGKTYIPLKDKMMAEGGSIQNIAEIPAELKEVFVCITDIKLKDLTEMARDRAVFTDQSMSLNVHFRNKDDMMPDLLKYMLFAWKLGLKTISYYTRTIQQLAALNFTGNSVKEAASCVVCSS